MVVGVATYLIYAFVNALLQPPDSNGQLALALILTFVLLPVGIVMSAVAMVPGLLGIILTFAVCPRGTRTKNMVFFVITFLLPAVIEFLILLISFSIV